MTEPKLSLVWNARFDEATRQIDVLTETVARLQATIADQRAKSMLCEHQADPDWRVTCVSDRKARDDAKQKQARASTHSSAT